MWIESDDRRHSTNCSRALHDRTHDQLMTKMQSIKNTERKDRRAMDTSVVRSVKETHMSDGDLRSQISDNCSRSSVSVRYQQLRAICNQICNLESPMVCDLKSAIRNLKIS